jgi:hypothetical protein
VKFPDKKKSLTIKIYNKKGHIIKKAIIKKGNKKRRANDKGG